MTAGGGPGSHFRADLEGTRAIAVVLVLLYHAGLPGLPGGYIGVDVFFVLSGFFITGLLLRELQLTGRISLPTFYARRARRLLPAAGLTLVAILIGTVLFLPATRWGDTAGDVASAALYVSNMRFGVQANDYFVAVGTTLSPVLHFWSLSVEEQFYLFWPAIILVAAVIGRRYAPSKAVITLAIAAISIGSLLLCIWLTTVSQSWAFYLLPTRAWELGVGGVLAIMTYRLRGRSARSSSALTVAGLCAIGLAAVLYTDATPFPGIAATVPALGACLIIMGGSRAEPTAISRWIGSTPMRYIGSISYSVYLWHWPLIVFGQAAYGPNPPLLLSLGLAFSAIPVAAVSQRLIENPFRYGRFIGTRTRWNLAQAAALMVVVVGVSGLLVLAGRSVLQEQSGDLIPPLDQVTNTQIGACGSIALVASPDGCVYGDAASDKTVVLFGDSHARQWFPTVLRLANERGWRFVSLARGGCPSADVEVVAERDTEDCARLRAASEQRIAVESPDLVIISNLAWPGLVIDGAPTTDRPAVLANWEQGLRDTLSTVLPMARHVVVVLQTPEPTGDVPTCLIEHRADMSACDLPISSVPSDWDQVERSAAEAFAIPTIDPAPWLCGVDTCPAVIDRYVVYADNSHLTETFADRLASQLGPSLNSIAPELR